MPQHLQLPGYPDQEEYPPVLVSEQPFKISEEIDTPVEDAPIIEERTDEFIS